MSYIFFRRPMSSMSLIEFINRLNEENEEENDEENEEENLEIGQKLLYSELKLENSESSCPICKDDFKDNTEIVVTFCMHVFCYKCLFNWVYELKKITCPICREKFC